MTEFYPAVSSHALDVLEPDFRVLDLRDHDGLVVLLEIDDGCFLEIGSTAIGRGRHIGVGELVEIDEGRGPA